MFYIQFTVSFLKRIISLKSRDKNATGAPDTLRSAYIF